MSYDGMMLGLIAFTLLAAIIWGIWQFVRTRKSQQRSGDPHGAKATQDALHAHDNTRK